MRNAFFRFVNRLRSSLGLLSQPKSGTMVSATDTPLIVILGGTGTGKTKLSIELCQRFNGEVISADSMQIYTELDIVTNKVTAEEASGVPHHLISMVSPLTLGFSVAEFRDRALNLIEQISSRGRLPVIVGGTNYYIEALLWKRLVGPPVDTADSSETNNAEIRFNGNDHLPFDVNAMSDQELHNHLREVDPKMAERRHATDRRRVIRSLQLFYQTGRSHSDWLSEQRSAVGGNQLGGPLRFRSVCVFWLCCEADQLDIRLRRRVDEMEERGIRVELESFFDRYYEEYMNKYIAEFGDSPDNTKGIFQSIGLKEFGQYLRLSPDDRCSAAGEKAFKTGMELLKVATIRYSKKQKRWVVNRFCRLAARDNLSIYRLDSTNADRWPEDVSAPAVKIVTSFLADQTPTANRLDLSLITPMDNVEQKHAICEICNRSISNLQWDYHIKSKGHRRLKAAYNVLQNRVDSQTDSTTG